MSSEALLPTPPANERAGTPPPEIRPELLDPEALKVLRHLRRNGHQAYLVGGCVRDLLLGRKPKDFDIATSASPEQVRATFRNCRLIGRRFRLAHVYFKGRKIIEVSTFRKNPGEEDGFAGRRAEAEGPAHAAEEDGFAGRRAEAEGPAQLPEQPISERAIVERAVAEAPEAQDLDIEADELLAPDGAPEPEKLDAADDLLISEDNVFGTAEEDARRRDFTINGLFYDVTLGEVIDYVGGRQDLESRLIRTIGNPAIRLREDPVRILRAIRFAAKLGLAIEPQTALAMRAHATELGRCAQARVLEETLRLLRCGASRRSFELLREASILRLLLPPVDAFLEACGPAEAERLFALLGEADRRVALGLPTSDSLLLAALLLRLARPASGSGAPAIPVAPLLADLVRNSRLPRRIAEGTQLLLLAQRALQGEQRRRGSPTRFVNSPHFDDALALMAMNAQASGEGQEPLQRWRDRVAAVRPPAAMPAPGEPATFPPPGPRAEGEGGRRSRHRRGGHRDDRLASAPAPQEAPPTEAPPPSDFTFSGLL